MKLTPKQQIEIERLKWFSKRTDFTDKEINEYFDWSEHGIGTGGILSLIKEKQGITMGMWEQGILDGSVSYFTLLGGEDKKELPPLNVINFIKKEMFKGVDADIIECTYQDILRSKIK